MTREDIEQWTREVGGFDATPEFLAKFAALVASAEREHIAKEIEKMTVFGKDTISSFTIVIRSMKRTEG